MASNRLAAIMAVLFLVAAAPSYELSIANQVARTPDEPRDMISAAKATYDATVEKRKREAAVTVTDEDLYLWSHRIVEATMAEKNLEAQGAALRDHVDRMKELHERAEALDRAGARGIDSAMCMATSYYLLSAEHDLAAWQKSQK